MRIFWRLFLSGFFIIFLVVLLFTLLIISEIEKHDKAITEERLLTEANLLREIFQTPIIHGNKEEIKSLVSQLGRKTDVRITVIDKDGLVIGDSYEDPSRMENHSRRPEVVDAISEGTGKSIRYSTTVKKDMFYVAVPVLNRRGEVEGVVRAALPLSFFGKAFLSIQSKIIYAGLVLTFLALVLSLVSSRTLTKPIEKTIRLSEEIARGNFNVNIPILETKGEMGKLALALNKMAEELNGLFKQVFHEKAQLEAVLSAMSEGVMVTSSNGKVILINHALREMFRIKDDPYQKPYWEVLRNRELIDLVENVFKERNSAKKEISIFYPIERYYLANAIPLDSPGKEVIVVIFDISDFKRLEKIKADLIANVSHELRTPLTAIKGYIETLEEGCESPEERMHFLNIIKRHTDRLINIVSDLLVLSEIESKESLWKEESKADFEEIDFKEIVTSSFEALKSKISEKKLQASFDVKENLPSFKGNRFLLEQMLINLIDNAVKYTPEGGTIGVRVTQLDSRFRIEVFDTGIGIPKEHLPRIFERFYRVDKTRSRKLGGTGLGLSIVKHVAIIHGGKVEVESEEGKGSKFIITL